MLLRILTILFLPLFITPPVVSAAEAERNRKGKLATKETFATNVLPLQLIVAYPNPQMKVINELAGKSNYFIGNDAPKWGTNIRSYAKVNLEEVYPEVGYVFSGNQRNLEYGLVVAPGPDPSVMIRTSMAEDGHEQRESSVLNLTQHTPLRRSTNHPSLSSKTADCSPESRIELWRAFRRDVKDQQSDHLLGRWRRRSISLGRVSGS
jgi:hypothetical protein